MSNTTPPSARAIIEHLQATLEYDTNTVMEAGLFDFETDEEVIERGVDERDGAWVMIQTWVRYTDVDPTYVDPSRYASWDIFDVETEKDGVFEKGLQVQRIDDLLSPLDDDHEAIALARAAGIVCDDEGWVTAGSAIPIEVTT